MNMSNKIKIKLYIFLRPLATRLKIRAQGISNCAAGLKFQHARQKQTKAKSLSQERRSSAVSKIIYS